MASLPSETDSFREEIPHGADGRRERRPPNLPLLASHDTSQPTDPNKRRPPPPRRQRHRPGQSTNQWSEDLRPFPPEKSSVGGESLTRRRAAPRRPPCEPPGWMGFREATAASFNRMRQEIETANRRAAAGGVGGGGPD